MRPKTPERFVLSVYIMLQMCDESKRKAGVIVIYTPTAVTATPDSCEWLQINWI